MFSKAEGYFPERIGESQRIRRFGRSDSNVWENLLRTCHRQSPRIGLKENFLIDTFSFKVCRKLRIWRSQLCQGEAYVDYTANKRECFYSFKRSLSTSTEG